MTKEASSILADLQLGARVTPDEGDKRPDDSPESGEASGPDMSKYAVNDAMLDVISNHRLSAREREQPRADN